MFRPKLLDVLQGYDRERLVRDAAGAAGRESAAPTQLAHLRLESLLVGELFNDSFQFPPRFGESPRLLIPTHRLDSRLPIVLLNRRRHHFRDDVRRQR